MHLPRRHRSFARHQRGGEEEYFRWWQLRRNAANTDSRPRNQSKEYIKQTYFVNPVTSMDQGSERILQRQPILPNFERRSKNEPMSPVFLKRRTYSCPRFPVRSYEPQLRIPRELHHQVPIQSQHQLPREHCEKNYGSQGDIKHGYQNSMQAEQYANYRRFSNTHLLYGLGPRRIERPRLSGVAQAYLPSESKRFFQPSMRRLGNKDCRDASFQPAAYSFSKTWKHVERTPSTSNSSPSPNHFSNRHPSASWKPQEERTPRTKYSHDWVDDVKLVPCPNMAFSRRPSPSSTTTRKNKKNRQREKKNMECDKCCKTFRTMYGLKRHKLVHTNRRKFKCGLCQARFKQKCHLVTHIERLHANFNGEFAAQPKSMHIQHEEDDDDNAESQDLKAAWAKIRKRGNEALSSSGDEAPPNCKKARLEPMGTKVTVAKLYHGSCPARVLRQKAIR